MRQSPAVQALYQRAGLRSLACHLRPAKATHAWRQPAAAAGAASTTGAAPCPPLSLRPMQERDLPALKRMHKFCKVQGRPVFGGDLRGVDEMLEHAAAGKQGTLGLVLVSSAGSAEAEREEEEEEEEVVGGVTAQTEVSETAPPSGSKGDGGPPGPPPQTAAALVLLSIVVRADQRQRGAGRSLLEALHERARAEGLARVVTDVAVANAPALAFFEAAGYRRARADKKTVELEFVLSRNP